jgi:hypothetical protein
MGQPGRLLFWHAYDRADDRLKADYLPYHLQRQLQVDKTLLYQLREETTPHSGRELGYRQHLCCGLLDTPTEKVKGEFKVV